MTIGEEFQLLCEAVDHILGFSCNLLYLHIIARLHNVSRSVCVRVRVCVCVCVLRAACSVSICARQSWRWVRSIHGLGRVGLYWVGSGHNFFFY